MMNELDSNIRFVKKEDIPALKKVIDSSELFPSEMLDDMMSPYFSEGNEEEFWMTYELEEEAVAITYFAPERMTNGTYNLYLIAVDSKCKGKGIGDKLLKHIEHFLKEKGLRILIIETSSLPEFAGSRAFYEKNNYNQEARIREFYDEGDDKIVYWKKL